MDQLLDAARAEAGELKLDRRPGELGALLAELAQAFAPLAERKRIRVEPLAESMGVGRRLLFQRTRELLERTPMELIMSRRLERAAELLSAGEGNVGEVAYAVGFRSVAHFTNRFRERFKTTPSAWRRGERPAATSAAATA